MREGRRERGGRGERKRKEKGHGEKVYKLEKEKKDLNCEGIEFP